MILNNFPHILRNEMRNVVNFKALSKYNLPITHFYRLQLMKEQQLKPKKIRWFGECQITQTPLDVTK